MSKLALGERRLDLDDLQRLRSARPPGLVLDEAARPRVLASRAVVDAAMSEGRTCYGINTGFGRLSSVRIPEADLKKLQVNLVRSHAVGVGEPLPEGTSRLAFALRAANMARGYSGVRVRLVEHVLDVFNAGIVPVIPGQGSVGASGDLAPLAHIALVLIGEGRAVHRGKTKDAKVALADAGLAPVRLHSKEGLALLNGTQVSTAILADALLDARRVAACADIACALTLEAYGGTEDAYDARIHALRGQAGQERVAETLRRLLDGSSIQAGHAGGYARVQDNYCLRCAPQVHGASRDAMAYVTDVVVREVNAVTDNPLVFEDGSVVSGGNFHAQPVAVAADLLKIATAELANISERRTELLLNPDVSGLPAFLATNGGVESGLMIAQVTAAALVSENKVLAHPASVDSIPTSAGKEDHVSMATHAARHARVIVDNVAHVLAVELLAGLTAFVMAKRARPGKGVAAAVKALREVVRPLTGDRILSGDLAALHDVIVDGRLVDAVEGAVGPLL